MGEEDRQEAFREEVREYLASDKKALEALGERMDKIEKTLIHGNGSPSIIAQVAEIRTRVDMLEKTVEAVNDLKEQISSINERLSKIETKLETKLNDDARKHGDWIGFALVILTVIAEGFIAHFFR